MQTPTVDMDRHVERVVRGVGCARRRRERRLRSALRHEQRSVAMAVCTALHHSSNKNKKKEVEEEELYHVPRHQQTQTVTGFPGLRALATGEVLPVHGSTLVRFLLQQSLEQHAPTPQDDVEMLMDSVPKFAAKLHRVLEQVSLSCSCAMVECGRFCFCSKEFPCAAPCTSVWIVECFAVFSGLFSCVSQCSCAAAGEQSNH